MDVRSGDATRGFICREEMDHQLDRLVVPKWFQLNDVLWFVLSCSYILLERLVLIHRRNKS